MTNDLQEMAIATLARDPEGQAIEFEGCWHTYGQMHALSETIGSLLDQSGIRSDGPVALLARNRPSALTAYLALIAQGRNIQMIYTFQSPAGIARDLHRLEPAALVADIEDFSEPVREALAELGMAAVALDGMSARAVEPFAKAGAGAERAGPQQRQIGIFTSGTTGPPKQFPLPQDAIARHLVAPGKAPDGVDPASLAPQLVFFPAGNISGIYAILVTLLNGRRAILIDRFSLEVWHQYVLRYRPTTGGIPPSYYQMLLDSDIPVEDLSSIKAMFSGAAPVDPEVQREFEDRYGIPLITAYGATEFGGTIASMTIEDHAKYGRSKLGTVGRPIPGARLRIVDPDTGEELPAGEVGLIEVVSPRFGPEWIHTTDLGMIDEDGFVYHRGRADGAIVRGGFKILPETVELALKAHPLVSEALVVGIPDRRLGQVPAALVQLGPGAKGVDADTLDAHLRERIMKTHIPARWLFCEEMPRTISAKLDRNAARAMFEAQAGETNDGR